MSRVRYYYDPDTLSYRKIETKKKNRRIFLVLFLFLFIGFAGGSYFGSTFKVPIIEQDTPFSIHDLKKMSTALIEIDKILLATQNQIDELVAFTGRQNNSIRKNQDKADKQLEKTQIKNQRIIENIKNLNEDVFKLNQERKIAKKALSMDQETIASYEINTRWERMKTSMIPPLITFFLGFFLNSVLIKNSKKKITKEVQENLEFKKAAYDSGFRDVKDKHSEELQKIQSNHLTEKIKLIEKFDKKEEIIRNEILKKSILISDLKLDLDKRESLLDQERELTQSLRDRVKYLNIQLNLL